MRIISAIRQDLPLPITHRWKSGIASLDRALGGGIAAGRIHEVYTAEAENMASAGGFVLALATAMNSANRAILWLRTSKAMHVNGTM